MKHGHDLMLDWDDHPIVPVSCEFLDSCLRHWGDHEDCLPLDKDDDPIIPLSWEIAPRRQSICFCLALYFIIIITKTPLTQVPRQAGEAGALSTPTSLCSAVWGERRGPACGEDGAWLPWGTEPARWRGRPPGGVRGLGVRAPASQGVRRGGGAPPQWPGAQPPRLSRKTPK